ncbi:hypothetical protein Tco_1341783 [Tanacetum coccineum]
MENSPSCDPSRVAFASAAVVKVNRHLSSFYSSYLGMYLLYALLGANNPSGGQSIMQHRNDLLKACYTSFKLTITTYVMATNAVTGHPMSIAVASKASLELYRIQRKRQICFYGPYQGKYRFPLTRMPSD